MDEAKTKLVLEAETRGFDKVQKIVDDVVGTVEGSGTKAGALASLDKTLSSIAGSLAKLDDTVRSIVKSAGELDKRSKGTGGAGAGGAGAGGAPPVPLLRDPNFVRGLLQGLGVGQYLPGATTGALAAQATGAMIGRGVRGVGGGIASSAFNGIGSLIQGLGSVPGGGLVAGPMNAAVAAVEQALALQQAQQGAAFALDLAGGSRAARGARAAVGPAAGVVASSASSSYIANANAERIAELEKFIADGYAKAAIGGPAYRDGTVFMREVEKAEETWRTLTEGGKAGDLYERAIEARASQAGGEAGSATMNAQDAAAASARFRALYGMSGGDFAGLGVRYGMDQTELTRFASEVARSRGGTIGAMGAGGGTQAALAASVLGIDAGTSGRVLRGVEIGAVGGGSEGDVLARTIGRAMALGLEGSDIAEDIARTAQGIEQFERTGLPLAETTRTNIARALIDTGMAGPVAAGRGAAFTSSIQSRAMQGLPTSATDFAALVKLGGYTGGGTEEALEALFRMQRGEFTGDQVMDLASSYAGIIPSGPAGRAFGIQQGFKGYMSMSADDAHAFDLVSRGETLPDARAAIRDRALERIDRANKINTAAQIDAYASQGVGGGVQRQAGIRNTTLAAGMTAMSTVQDFEDRTARATRSFGKLVDKLELLNPVLDQFEGIISRVIDAATGSARMSGGN